MSIPNLPVNFKDDILAGSNAKRKYQQTFNSDGSVSLEDVTVYTQKGSDFGASQVNQTNGAVNNIYDERILDLEELELVTEPGFFVDAQAAKEAYDSLNSKSIENVTKTINGLSCTFQLSKIGKLVVCNINAVGTLSSNGAGVNDIIPTEYRPTQKCYATAYNVTGTELHIGHGCTRYTIDTNGRVIVESEHRGTLERHAFATWFTA